MHSLVCWVFLAVAATILNCPGAVAADPGAKELAKLQGDWTAEVDTDSGKKKATMTVTAKKIRFDRPDGLEWYEGTFEINVQTKPKRISVTIKDCPIEQFKNQTVEGIYSLDQRTWTICATAPGSPNGPSGFDDEKARKIEFKKAK